MLHLPFTVDAHLVVCVELEVKLLIIADTADAALHGRETITDVTVPTDVRAVFCACHSLASHCGSALHTAKCVEDFQHCFSLAVLLALLVRIVLLQRKPMLGTVVARAVIDGVLVTTCFFHAAVTLDVLCVRMIAVLALRDCGFVLHDVECAIEE